MSDQTNLTNEQTNEQTYEQNTNQNIEQVPKHIKELRPIKFNFNGSTDDLLKKFYGKVRAMDGVVKYHMVDWDGFPTEIETAKQLAKTWAKEFASNQKFDGFIVNIYFHLQKKTIRFEVKSYKKLEVRNFILEQCESVDSYKNQVFSKLNNQPGIYVFDSSCWNFELTLAKELAKNWATELEVDQTYSGLSLIIFFNPAIKNIKVTIKSRN